MRARPRFVGCIERVRPSGALVADENVVARSYDGHDAFLAEPERLEALVAPRLASLYDSPVPAWRRLLARETSASSGDVLYRHG